MALNEQMQQMVQQDIQDAETRPKDEILQEQMDGLKTAGRTARDIAVESIPGVSEALAEKRVDEALQRGDTTGAMIEGAAGLMGAVPIFGDAAAKGLRAATKAFRKSDVEEAEKLINNPDLLKKWEEDNTLPESQRQKNIPEAEQAAEDLFQGNIKSKKARKRIKKVFPEPKLYTAETMPEMPTVTEVAGSMGKKALAKGIVGVKGFDIEAGQRLGARLDIPAYNRFNKWVVSIHDGKNRSGSVVGYGQAIRLKNIEFGSDPKIALDIAKGKRVAKTTGEEKPMGKATIARVYGDYVPEDPYELQEFARKILADKDSSWTQVGMNPYRGSYFYDKATGTPVTRADEVIQVGPLVLAKNVTKPKMSELKELFKPAARTAGDKLRIFNEGGAVPMNNMAKQMEMFDDGGLMDEGGTVDPVSGNDVPPGSTKEEVRDDIPAQLSEGEFVFPADVVRYIGLENLMRMRQEAKQGLAEMEAMGQMGNSEEATMPDNLPFNEYDLDIEDDGLEMNVGGYVPPSINPMTGVYQTGSTGITGFQNYQGQPTGYTPYGGATPFFQPAQFTGPQYTTALQTTNLPTFAETVGSRAGQYDELIKYQNAAGQILQIPFKNGQPIYPIPEGYSKAPDEPEISEQQTNVTPTMGQVRTASESPEDGAADKADVDLRSTDVTGFKVTRKGLTPELLSVFNDYGSGFGVLKETFLDRPASALMEAGSRLPISAMNLIGSAVGADPYKAPAMTSSLQAASLQGVIDAFRGIKDTNFSSPTSDFSVSANIRRTNDIYGGGIVGTKDLGTLDKSTQNIVATVARAVVEKSQNFYFEKVGAEFKGLSSSKVNAKLRDALKNDFKMSADEIEAIARRGGNYNQNLKLNNEWSKRTAISALREKDASKNIISKAAIEDFNKAAKESEVSYTDDKVDRSREATFSDKQPGSVAEQAAAEKASADMGIFGP